MNTKKGAIELEFNWILVLVAGALIMGFFWGIISWVQDSSESGNAATTINYLDSILTGSSVSLQTINEIDIPFKQIELTCNRLSVNEGKGSMSIRNKIVFGPSRIEKSVLYTWTLAWNAPMRITNFLYLTSSKIRYIIIGDENSVMFKYLKETFPNELEPEFNPGEIKDQNHFKVRFIYIDQEPNNNDISDLADYPGEDITAIRLENVDPKGLVNIMFYKKNLRSVVNSRVWGSGQESTSFGEAAIYAAIFSDDRGEYECNMDKALERFRSVTRIYKQRSRDIADHFAGNSCYQPHDQAVQLMNDTLTGSASQSTLEAYAFDMQARNSDAQRKSCPMIY